MNESDETANDGGSDSNIIDIGVRNDSKKPAPDKESIDFDSGKEVMDKIKKNVIQAIDKMILDINDNVDKYSPPPFAIFLANVMGIVDTVPGEFEWKYQVFHGMVMQNAQAIVEAVENKNDERSEEVPSETDKDVDNKSE